MGKDARAIAQHAEIAERCSDTSNLPAGQVAEPAPRQYLKISFSSKRRMNLVALAKELGCSWESIALGAIDEALDRELSPKKLV